MRNLITIFLLLAAVLCLSRFCEAKCREKNSAKLKRSFKLAISSDKINSRHKAGIRKIFRRRRNIKDEDVTESDTFTAEIKFLQKWNPAMGKKDGSAYRLFQGNVLDAILEQMNADRRFINSHVLDLKKTSDGILAKVGFHFKKGEHNPVSHIRFVVSGGHLSSLKVDKHYFKIVKTPGKPSDAVDSKTSSKEEPLTDKQKMLQKKPKISKQEPQQKPETQQDNNGSPSATNGNPSQAQTENQPTDETLNSASAQYPNQVQNEAKSQDQSSAQAINQATPVQNQATPVQNQATESQTQDQTQNTKVAQPEQSQDQNKVGVTSQQQTQEAGQAPSQNPAQGQNNIQVTNNDYYANQPQTQYDASSQQQTESQDQNTAVSQTAEQPNTQSTPSQIVAQQDQNTAYQPNPNNNMNPAQTQSNDKTNVGNKNQENQKPSDNTPQQTSNQQSSYSTAIEHNNEDNISIKMNQAWFPFLSNHDSPQYKMLAGNLEKGLKSVMADDQNIKDIKVKNLLQADEGHTTIELLLTFNGGKEGSTEKLRNIIKTGDVAGISVDGSFFKTQ